MLKIKQKKGRGWGRLFSKICVLMALFFLLFGVLFGLTRGSGLFDGDLVLFCRVCKDFAIGDALLMSDGSIMEYGDVDGGLVVGKVIAKLSVRGFIHETCE